MASRFKEDEKNEKIIRGLLKLPANKKCINCNSLGPQYVCTNFWTFICTTCSGIHREFTHRVKSVSMAKFTSQEVTALQEGGNERAKMIYFKELDLQRHSFPDSSNVERLRTFIKHVYVDQRYSGDRSVDRPPRHDRDDTYERRRPETFRGESQSPSYGDSYDRRYGDRAGSGPPGGRNDESNSRYSYEPRRSPGYEQGDYRRSPGRFETFDDKRRDDKIIKGNQTVRYEERRSSDGTSRTGGRSPSSQDNGVSSPPIVHPVRDIVGGDSPAIQMEEPPKSNARRVIEAPPQAQRTASSSPAGGSPPEVKSVTPAPETKNVTTAPAAVKSVATESLIDLSADFGSPVSAPQEQSDLQSATPPVDCGDWASFDNVAGQNPTPVTNSKPLDSGLAELYAPASSSTVSNLSGFPATSASISNTTGQWPTSQQNENSLFSVAEKSVVPQSVAPQSTLHGISTNSQPWGATAAPNGTRISTASTGQISQISILPHIEQDAGISSQVQSVEAKSNERKELPADLFTSSYPMGPGVAPNWQARPQYGMGFAMQYPTAVMAAQSFSYQSNSANPFEISSGPTLVHAATFPSMAPLQGALPSNDGPQGMLRTSSLGSTPQWMPQQQLSNPLAAASGGYMSQIQNNMGQQTTGNTFPMGTQVIGNVGNQQFAFGAPVMSQNLNSSHSQQGASNYFARTGGNPFG